MTLLVPSLSIFNRDPCMGFVTCVVACIVTISSSLPRAVTLDAKAGVEEVRNMLRRAACRCRCDEVKGGCRRDDGCDSPNRHSLFLVVISALCSVRCAVSPVCSGAAFRLRLNIYRSAILGEISSVREKGDALASTSSDARLVLAPRSLTLLQRFSHHHHAHHIAYSKLC